MDGTYKLELWDLNELNFARFDAKLEQRIAELRAELRTGLAALEARFEAKLEQRIAELRGEIARLAGRLLARLGVVEGRYVHRPHRARALTLRLGAHRVRSEGSQREDERAVA